MGKALGWIIAIALGWWIGTLIAPVLMAAIAVWIFSASVRSPWFWAGLLFLLSISLVPSVIRLVGGASHKEQGLFFQLIGGDPEYPGWFNDPLATLSGWAVILVSAIVLAPLIKFWSERSLLSLLVVGGTIAAISILRASFGKPPLLS